MASPGTFALSLADRLEAMDRPRERRWASPLDMACELDRTVVRTPALECINRELVALAGGGEDRLMVFMPPQEGKPVAIDSMVLMGDGSRKQLADVQVGEYVITHKGRPQLVTAVHEQGELPVVTITTHAGRIVTAALDHPFLTPSGWVNAGELSVGDVLAVVPRPETTGKETLSAEAARLLGYFVGDGSTSFTNPGSRAGAIAAFITCVDDVEWKDIIFCAETLGFGVNERPSIKRVSFKGGVRDWLRHHGLAGCNSKTKRVPSEVFTQPPHIIAEFLGAYFACDGTVSRRGGARPDARCEFSSINRELLSDVQHLLLRLGIGSTIRAKNAVIKGQRYVSWRLLLRRQDDVARFRALVPIHHGKAGTLNAWPLRRTNFDGQLIGDSIEAITVGETAECRCLTVDEDHTFTAEDLVVHNSTLCSKWYPLWRLVCDPDRRIAIVSYSDEMARRWGADIKQLVETFNGDEDTIDLGLRLRGDSRAAGRWQVDGHLGGVYCVGIAGSLTGKPVDDLVLDDPIKDLSAAQSEAYRKRCQDFWQAVGIPRLGPGARCLLIQTRWHEEDMAGWLLAHDGEGDRTQGGRWKVVSIPAIAEDADDPLGRKIGEPMISARGDRDWERIRRSTGAYVWGALYQQTPSPAEGNVFKRLWWRYWRLLPAVGMSERLDLAGRIFNLSDCWRFATVDLANSTKTSADYTVISAWARTIAGDLVLLDRQRARIGEAEHFTHAKPLVERWQLDTLFVEKSQFGTSLVREATTAGVPIAPLDAESDKLTRALPASAWCNNGRVWLPAGAWWLKLWVDEHASFPTGRNDDQVDTLAYAVRVAITQWAPPPRDPAPAPSHPVTPTPDPWGGQPVTDWMAADF